MHWRTTCRVPMSCANLSRAKLLPKARPIMGAALPPLPSRSAIKRPSPHGCLPHTTPSQLLHGLLRRNDIIGCGPIRDLLSAIRLRPTEALPVDGDGLDQGEDVAADLKPEIMHGPGRQARPDRRVPGVAERQLQVGLRAIAGDDLDD